MKKINESGYISMSNFRPFFPCVRKNPRKPQIWPASLSQSGVKMRKIYRRWPKSNQFWRWSGYINMPNIRPLFLCVLKKMLRNRKINLFHWGKMTPKWEKPADDDQNLISSLGRQDRSTCQISGNSKWLQWKVRSGINFIIDGITNTK